MNRRDFLQTTTMAGIAILAGGPALAPSEIFQEAATTLPRLNPLFVKALNRATKIASNRQEDAGINNLHERYIRIGYGGKIDAPAYLKKIYRECFLIFRKAADFSEQMQILQSAPEESEKFIRDLRHGYFYLVGPYFKAKLLAVVQGAKQALEGKALWAGHHLKSPEISAEEAVINFTEQLDLWEKQLEKAKPSDILEFPDFMKIYNCRSFVDENSVPEIRKMDAKIDEIRKAYDEYYGLNSSTMALQHTHGWGVIDPEGHMKDHKIFLRIDETPEKIVKKLINGIKNYYKTPGRINRNVNQEFANEIYLRFEDEASKWLPGLIKQFFPQVWQEMAQGHHPEIREKLKDKSGHIHDEELNRIAYCDYAWFQIHKGNDYY